MILTETPSTILLSAFSNSLETDPDIQKEGEQQILQLKESDNLLFIFTCSEILDTPGLDLKFYQQSLIYLSHSFIPTRTSTKEQIHDFWIEVDLQQRQSIAQSIFNFFTHENTVICSLAAHAFAQLFNIESTELLYFFDNIKQLLEQTNTATTCQCILTFFSELVELQILFDDDSLHKYILSTSISLLSTSINVNESSQVLISYSKNFPEIFTSTDIQAILHICFENLPTIQEEDVSTYLAIHHLLGCLIHHLYSFESLRSNRNLLLRVCLGGLSCSFPTFTLITMELWMKIARIENRYKKYNYFVQRFYLSSVLTESIITQTFEANFFRNSEPIPLPPEPLDLCSLAAGNLINHSISLLFNRNPQDSSLEDPQNHSLHFSAALLLSKLFHIVPEAVATAVQQIWKEYGENPEDWVTIDNLLYLVYSVTHRMHTKPSPIVLSYDNKNILRLDKRIQILKRKFPKLEPAIQLIFPSKPKPIPSKNLINDAMNASEIDSNFQSESLQNIQSMENFKGLENFKSMENSEAPTNESEKNNSEHLENSGTHESLENEVGIVEAIIEDENFGNSETELMQFLSGIIPQVISALEHPELVVVQTAFLVLSRIHTVFGWEPNFSMNCCTFDNIELYSQYCQIIYSYSEQSDLPNEIILSIFDTTNAICEKQKLLQDLRRHNDPNYQIESQNEPDSSNASEASEISGDIFPDENKKSQQQLLEILLTSISNFINNDKSEDIIILEGYHCIANLLISSPIYLMDYLCSYVNEQITFLDQISTANFDQSISEERIHSYKLGIIHMLSIVFDQWKENMVPIAEKASSAIFNTITILDKDLHEDGLHALFKICRYLPKDVYLEQKQKLFEYVPIALQSGSPSIIILTVLNIASLMKNIEKSKSAEIEFENLEESPLRDLPKIVEFILNCFSNDIFNKYDYSALLIGLGKIICAGRNYISTEIMNNIIEQVEILAPDIKTEDLKAPTQIIKMEINILNSIIYVYYCWLKNENFWKEIFGQVKTPQIQTKIIFYRRKIFKPIFNAEKLGNELLRRRKPFNNNMKYLPKLIYQIYEVFQNSCSQLNNSKFKKLVFMEIASNPFAFKSNRSHPEKIRKLIKMLERIKK